ncbi:hypothetical protein EXIGLDRAFT_723879, partial [Exidia glandulosa HHB12029]
MTRFLFSPLFAILMIIFSHTFSVTSAPKPRTALDWVKFVVQFYVQGLAIVGKIVGAGLLITVTLTLLGWGLFTISYPRLVQLQDSLSNASRRRRFGDNNSRNRAASLPPEVQLRIFWYLQQRGHFGFDPYSRLARLLPYPPTLDLRAVARVCRSWHGAGTEMLYASIWLMNDSTCLLFGDTLAARPELARLVQRIALPNFTSYLPHLDPQTSLKHIRPSRSSPLWKDVKSAIDRIIVLCVNATDVQLCGDVGDPELFTGLMQCIPHTTKLSLMRSEASIFTTAPRRYEETHLQLCSPVLRPHVAHLHELTLFKYTLDEMGEFPSFECLVLLRLVSCKLETWWLTSLLANTPNLRALDWRDNNIDAPPLGPATPFWLVWTLTPRIQDCEKLIAVQEDSFTRSKVTLGAMTTCTSLRVLEITANLLHTLEYPPPHLAQLILLNVRDRSSISPPISVRETRNKVFSIAARIKHSLPMWKLHAPHLHTIQLWDTLDKKAVETWTVTAVLLHEFLSTWDVSLVV